MFVASTDYMFWMFDGMRQFIAVCITLGAFSYILEKRYVTAIGLILLAATIHGSALLMLAYTLLMISIFRTALIAPDGFGRCLCAGLGAVLALHTIVNIGMSIRLMPVTGLPLPLVSYGGTFMLATLSCLGIVQSVYARRNLNSED